MIGCQYLCRDRCCKGPTVLKFIIYLIIFAWVSADVFGAVNDFAKVIKDNKIVDPLLEE